MREQRVYTHQTCNTETIVTDVHFQGLSDPLADIRRTYCAACEDYFPVEEFVWSDTNEPIPEYYARYLKNATPTDLWWYRSGGGLVVVGAGLMAGVLLGFVIGAVSSLLIGILAGVVLALVGVVFGAMLHEPLIGKPIIRRVCGVEDTRELN